MAEGSGNNIRKMRSVRVRDTMAWCSVREPDETDITVKGGRKPSFGGVKLTVEQLAKGTHHMQTLFQWVGRLLNFFWMHLYLKKWDWSPCLFQFFSCYWSDLLQISASHLPEVDCFLFTWLGKASVFWEISPKCGWVGWLIPKQGPNPPKSHSCDVFIHTCVKIFSTWIPFLHLIFWCWQTWFNLQFTNQITVSVCIPNTNRNLVFRAFLFWNLPNM